MPESLKARVGPRLSAFLEPLLRESRLQVRYDLAEQLPEAARQGPELVVEFHGADAPLLVTNDCELLRSIEHLAFETLRLSAEDHDRLMFDCQGRRQLRIEELRTLARMAAERVLKNGLPYALAPMHARDRRIVHLALQDTAGIVSESEGVGRDRHIVIRKPGAAAPAPAGGRREYRRL